MTPFQLAGLETLTKSAKSVFLGLYALHENDSQKFADASLLEYDIQCMQWGKINEFHGLNRSQMIETFDLCRVFLTSSSQ